MVILILRIIVIVIVLVLVIVIVIVIIIVIHSFTLTCRKLDILRHVLLIDGCGRKSGGPCEEHRNPSYGEHRMDKKNGA